MAGNIQLTQEKLDALRSEYKQRNAHLKYPRPKTKPEYQSIYPWLLPDDIDPHFVFCTVCECRLSAKRSDLGKHEGSIKHTENAHKKGLLTTTQKVEVEDNSVVVPDVKWEYNDFVDDNLFGAATNLLGQDKTDDDEVGGGADSGDDGGEQDDDDDYNPAKKRRISETDSQHSGLLEFLPLQVTINEAPNTISLQATTTHQQQQQLQPQIQHFTPQVQQQQQQLTNQNPNLPLQYQPAPCRITIKKVTAPLTKPNTLNPTSTQTNEITTKATITPIAGNYASTRHPTPPQPTIQLSKQINYTQSTNHQSSSSNAATALPVQATISNQHAHTQLGHALFAAAAPTPLRDSFDLFFDSICATVKALPPKLATEGKIRVMQLIGELEMRAIAEREGTPQNSIASAAASSSNVQNSSVGQQNATVASTTR